MAIPDSQQSNTDSVEPNDTGRIREIIENWGIWRDTADWENLLGSWHPGGSIVTTWFQGTAEEFVRRCKVSWEAGGIGHHFLGNSSIQIAANRAVAQTRLLLCVRATVDGVVCDCTCTGRFFDLFEKRGGGWGLIWRQPIYEKDRLDPVDPAARLSLDSTLLNRFPEGYRHLAYAQVKGGQTVFENLPGLRGPAVDRIYAIGKEWLKGTQPEIPIY